MIRHAGHQSCLLTMTTNCEMGLAALEGIDPGLLIAQHLVLMPSNTTRIAGSR
jgi:hypothetical protein